MEALGMKDMQQTNMNSYLLLLLNMFIKHYGKIMNNEIYKNLVNYHARTMRRLIAQERCKMDIPFLLI